MKRFLFWIEKKRVKRQFLQYKYKFSVNPGKPTTNNL